MFNDKIHYYGWNRIKEQLDKISETYNVKIIDYIDIYFLVNIDVITIPWYGFIHHTSSDFSDNNIINLFKNITFIQSLKTCKGIFTLSLYNKNNIVQELKKYNIYIKIYVVKHPMPPTFNKLFNIDNFNYTIYNIGGWLRNPYTIYHSNFTYNNKYLKKIKLKGYHMEQYFPDDTINYSILLNNMYNTNLYRYINDDNIYKITKNKSNNILYLYSHPDNLFYYFLEYLKKYISSLIDNYYKQNDILNILKINNDSVIIQDYQDNNDYLDIITNNIVFCDYIDCSASNTIIECISTATPIILNKHPAIVEYLGNDYPLYTENIYNPSIDTYILDKNMLYNAHNYLLNLSYSKDLTLDNFVFQVSNIIRYNNKYNFFNTYIKKNLYYINKICY